MYGCMDYIFKYIWEINLVLFVFCSVILMLFLMLFLVFFFSFRLFIFGKILFYGDYCIKVLVQYENIFLKVNNEYIVIVIEFFFVVFFVGGNDLIVFNLNLVIFDGIFFYDRDNDNIFLIYVWICFIIFVSI